MAAANTNFSLNKRSCLNKCPVQIKEEVKSIMDKFPEPNLVFGNSLWAKTPRTQFEIKVSERNLKTVPGYKKFDSSVTLPIEGYKVKFTKTSKRTAGASGGGPDKTGEQERGSVWILRRALKDNIVYKKWEDIQKDRKFNELEKIYPDINDDWIKTYYKQQARMLIEYSGKQYTEFNRDGGFMEYVTKLINQKFGYGLKDKDTWNPADIWILRHEDRVINLIKDNLKGDKQSQTIEELNGLLRMLFTAKNPKPGVVGVSLKKISGTDAKYEIYNLKKKDMLNEEGNYNIKTVEVPVDVLRPATKDVMKVYCLIVMEAKNTKYEMQIGRSGVGFNNIKFEVTDKSASAARAGKAPVRFVETLLENNGIRGWVNDHKQYPKTVEQFDARKQEYVNIFNTLNRKRVDLGVATADKFCDSIIKTLKKNPESATQKLMSMTFIWKLMSVSKKKQEEILTDMIFLAKKKGKTFGPFGKLY